MNDNEIFYKLFNGGNYALPWLIKFSAPGLNSIYLVNNNESIIYDSHSYTASSFSYTQPDSNGAGASLDISGIDNNLIEFVENASSMRLDIIGVIAENGEIQAFKQYKHSYGSVTYSNNQNLKFSFTKDDRLEMKFPPYKFDTDTNRGNA